MASADDCLVGMPLRSTKKSMYVCMYVCMYVTYRYIRLTLQRNGALESRVRLVSRTHTPKNGPRRRSPFDKITYSGVEPLGQPITLPT
jgi:hypothetical protein